MDPLLDSALGLQRTSPCINAGDPDSIYDDPDNTRNDIGAVFRLQATDCCRGTTGNVDDDPGDTVDISDLTLLVNHLFVTFESLYCREEANVSGDANCGIDISDLTALENHLFVTLEPLTTCNPGCK
ncbi:MAG: hypothetical protein V3T31_07535 [candidate division Zixibacteria bacterium]